jgi:hypothetical protein
MHHLVIPAIGNRRVLKLVCGGHERIVEPHVYGLDRSGEPVLLCYQVAGDGMSVAHGEWKLLKLRDAQAIVETDARFRQPRPGYKRGNADINEPLAAL